MGQGGSKNRISVDEFEKKLKGEVFRLLYGGKKNRPIVGAG